jgi:hypothetical protein
MLYYWVVKDVEINSTARGSFLHVFSLTIYEGMQ